MIKSLISNIGSKGKSSLVLAIISEAGGALVSAGIMLAIFKMLYALLDGGSFSLKPWLIIIGVLLAVKLVCAMAAMLTTHIAGFELETQLKKKILLRLKELSLAYYTNEQLGTISTIVHDDIEKIEKAVPFLGSKMLADSITALAIGVCLFVLDPVMGLIMISLIPIGIAVQVLSMRKTMELKNDNAKNLAQMVSRFVEFTRNMPMLKMFPGGMMFQGKVLKSAGTFSESSKAEAKQGAIDTVRYFIPLELCFALVVIFGGLLTWHGYISPETLIYFIVFSRLFYTPFANIESYKITFAQVKSSYGRVSELLEEKAIPEPGDPRNAERFDITYDNVCFNYSEQGFSLNDISVEIPQGSITAIVGSSGSGKTTFMNLLLRFWDVNSGSIKIGGVDIRDMNYAVLLERTSVVMQNVILFADTIYENIKVGDPNASKEDVEKAAKEAQIHDFILSLPEGYETMLGENGAKLSGGEKQRLSIARAFLKDSPILLLDELTSNVDSLNEVLIQRAINKLAENRTVIMIAHKLQTVRTAEKILVFDNGHIIEDGVHDDLLANDGRYRELWDAQNISSEWII